MIELLTEGAYGLQDEDCSIIQAEREQAMAFLAVVLDQEGCMLGDLRTAAQGPVAPFDGGLCGASDSALEVVLNIALQASIDSAETGAASSSLSD